MVPTAMIEDEADSSPRFNRLLTSVLGSPFITTSDLPPSDISLIRRLNAGADLEAVDGAFGAVPRAETVTRPTSPTPSFATDTYSVINWTDNVDWASAQPRPSFSDAAPGCSLLPGSRRSAPPYAYPYPSAQTPFNSFRISPSSSTSFKGPRNFNLLPRLWEVLRESSPAKKGKRRFDVASHDLWSEFGGSGYIDYANLPPLDGEEGELIDDEACFIDVRAVTGLDIIANIPDELALHLLSFLDLPDVVACLRVSRTWRRLASDNAVWRSLFARKRADGWLLDLRRLKYPALSNSKAILPKQDLTTSQVFELPAPLGLDWYNLYKNRAELDHRWSASPFPRKGEDKENAKAWEPRVRRMVGHTDSVYCLEFDASRIVTGSRDRTIKVWSLKTGRCLATFTGHAGSVLCLKFEHDFDLEDANALPGGQGWKKGTMVSGSSDCSVIVWNLYSYPVTDGDEEFATIAEVRGILRGHTGGVLDLRIESNWIISCGKDAAVLVWDRKTLTQQRAFRGHDGPVNAVGVQGNRLASASGDGKMILWDMSSGERLRTFDAHDRGLACIEFKGDLIISGSNDCKIKVWNASTGECLQTLTGHDMLVRTLAYDPSSGRLVSGSYDRSIKLWDVQTGRVLREFRGLHYSHIFDVKFNCCRIVSVSHDQQIVVLDFTEGLDTALFA